jgi:tRNA modification GTPase
MGPLPNAVELIQLKDTIIACATPSSSAMGLSVIRISGTFSNNQFNSVIHVGGPIGPLKPRVATLSKIINPQDGVCLDTGIVTFFPAPNSFTGESVLEISIHGNPRLVDKVISVFMNSFGMRLASPGEFTLRAYKNKKLNLSQVEGLDLLLHATTQPLIKLSQYMLEGNLQREFLELKNSFDKHQAAIDILTDFSEDIGEAEAKDLLHSTWLEIKKLITNFHVRCSLPLSHLLKPSIVLFGPPNAGKSTLFNFLLGYKRSIVSHIAGTTRDYVKESVFINDSEYFLIDTAGIRDSSDSIEEEGMHFTFKNLHDSAATVLVFSVINFNIDEFNYFFNLKRPSVVVFTHADNSCNYSYLPETGIPTFFTDFKSYNLNKDDFLTIFDRLLSEFFHSNPILIERQRIEIIKLFSLINEYEHYIMSDYSTDIGVVSTLFNQFRSSANNLIGYVDVDEILNYVFSNFCIGK